MIKRWIQINGHLVAADEVERTRERPSYYIAPDIKPYQSVITGEYITSRSHHRAHLKQHNAIEVGSEKPKWMKERNERNRDK